MRVNIQTEKLLLPLIILFLISSCEGIRTAEGYIIDADTGDPIDSVYCEVLTGEDWTYSDSAGYYFVENEFGGCVFGCPDIKVEYSKTGYVTISETNPSSDSEIIMESEYRKDVTPMCTNLGESYGNEF